LADPVAVREWQIMGLPGDEFSIENGMFSSMGRRWPLMIDPQAQANRWIKNTYKDKNLQIIKLSQKDFLRTLENAIRYGAPVLLENVQEELDPALEPVLMKQIFKKGGQRMIRLGDSDVPYSDEFKFFITTKLANPHYMPEICIKCTIINFTVTQKGLEDQLLVNVVQAERPELEEKKDKLVVNIAADKRALSEVEDKILKMLANSSGNILDDEELISWLAKSKVTSTAINVRMVEAEKTNAEINSTRELYRPVATRGSVIYFVIASLAMVDPMYQYSLQYYQSLYCQRLEKSEKCDILEKRLEILLSDITKNVYVNVCRGLFEKDKLLFSFMIAVNIARTAGIVSSAEVKTLMVGPGIGEDTSSPPQITWLTPKVWFDLCTLEKSNSTMAGICESIVKNESAWKRFATAEAPHLEFLPGMFEANLTNLQKLLVLRIFRTEKIVHGVREFVRKELGTEYTESPSFDLEGAFNDSTAGTPLIFVLSPGADINDYLVQLGQSKGKIVTEGSLKVISLGQGQGPIAEKLMLQARQNGDWVCLQNCHLAISWLPRLEQDLEQSMDMDIHPEFRLWLTSMPSDKFPVPILQNGIKITNEPPKGLKANLSRIFADLGEDQFEALTGTGSKEKAYKKLLFGLAFYNALILERRKFGAVGWNIPYGWMNSDLKTGIQQLRLYIEDQNVIPLETLNVIIADVTYGGRITDVWDKRTNSSLMRKFFCEDILDDAYRFDSTEQFFAPPTGSIAETRTFVSGFPVSDPPQTFGLHPNANITFQQKEVEEMVDTMILMEGGGGGGDSGSVDSDSVVADIAKKIQARMPAEFDLRKGHASTFSKNVKNGQMNSLGVFVSQELIRFNQLMKVISKSLEMLQKAIKGLVVMSHSLEMIYNCFLLQRVPEEWENAGYPCLKPLASWTEDFFARLDFMGSWLTNGPPKSYWISGFFFPQGFMTAVKQTHSRTHSIAVDILKVGCKFTTFRPQEIQSAAKSGVYLHGLFMEGGRVDRKTCKVEESTPGELFGEMPVVQLIPELEKNYDATYAGCYMCPLYKTSRRAGTLSTTGHSTNFVAVFPVVSDRGEDVWITRGCAMLCMLDT